MIYIEQHEKGLFVVDSDKLRNTSGRSMHEKAWRFKNGNKDLPNDSGRPVAGLACKNGKIEVNSNTYNLQSPSLDSATRNIDQEVHGDIIAIIQSIYEEVPRLLLLYAV